MSLHKLPQFPASAEVPGHQAAALDQNTSQSMSSHAVTATLPARTRHPSFLPPHVHRDDPPLVCHG
jgi:hypothetical protein